MPSWQCCIFLLCVVDTQLKNRKDGALPMRNAVHNNQLRQQQQQLLYTSGRVATKL
jgi:hypothetical protein